MTDPRRARYVALFAVESRSLLAGARRALTEWADAPGASAPGEELFRALHTVKGMSASLALDAVTELVHTTESDLSTLRGSGAQPARGWLRDMERSVDRIAVACEAAITDEGGKSAEDGAREARSTTPTFVRVDLVRLDALLGDLGHLVTARQELDRLVAVDEFSPLARAAQGMGRRLDTLSSRILDVRLAPLNEVLERLPPLIRDLARQLGKDVAVDVSGESLEVDRTILDQLGEPMLHLLRNAVDHGLETPDVRIAAGKRGGGRITISARRDGDTIVLEVRDDGRGIDRERVARVAKERGMLDEDAVLTDDSLLAVLAQPGFSTAATVTDVSGRGVGLDAVVARLQSVGASMALTTIAGRGTVFTLRLPTRIGIVPGLVTAVGGERYVLPLTQVKELVPWEPVESHQEGGRTVLDLHGEAVPVVDLRRLIGHRGTVPPGRRPAVVIEANNQRVALLADVVLGQVEAVVQPLDRPRGMPRWVTGAAVLGDGRPALMLDLAGVV